MRISKNVCYDSQEPVAETSVVQRSLGPVHGQHDRVPGRICAHRGLRSEHMWLDGSGLGRSSGSAQLGAGVLYAGGGRPARPDGIWRHRVAGVRPEPCAAICVVDRCRFRRASVCPAVSVGSVGGLLLHQRCPPLVRHDWTSELMTQHFFFFNG